MRRKPAPVKRVPKGYHVYVPEWGDGSPCSECMGSKESHRFLYVSVIHDFNPPLKRRKPTPA